jgi:hypothetical protein
MRVVDGGTFKDEAEGLKIPFERGTLGMANGGKNSESFSSVLPFRSF